MKEKPRKKLKKTVIGLGAFLGLILLLHAPVFREKLKISPDTTVISGPLNLDGTVNYVAALNTEMAAGVTKENNAALLLLEAFGPQAMGEAIWEETLRRVDIRVTPRADRFISWNEWLNVSSPATAPTQEQEELSPRDQFYRLVKVLDQGGAAPELEQWVTRNAEALRLITEASARPRFYIPLISEKEPPQLIDTGANQCLRSIRDAAFALGIRARIKAARGEFDSACSDVMTIHRVARLLDQSPSLVSHLVAIGADKAATDAATHIAARGKISTREAASFLAEMSTLKGLGQLKERVDRWERFQALDGLTVAHRSQRLKGWARYLRRSPIDLNEAMRELNRHYTRLVSVLDQACSDKWADARRKLEQYQVEMNEYMNNKNRTSYRVKQFLWSMAGFSARKMIAREIADSITSILEPSVEMALKEDLENAARLDLEKLTMAMARYRAENGTWPKTLSELCPEYADAIPQDRFTGESLIYRPTPRGYLLYSLGANLKDDAGVYDCASDKDDIAAEAD